MNPMTVIIVVGLSITVSVMILINFLPISEEVPTPVAIIEKEPKTITEPKPISEPEKLFTSDDLVAYPDRYNYEEAWNIMHKEYLIATEQCHDESVDVIELNECVTATNSRWLVIEDALERVFD